MKSNAAIKNHPMHPMLILLPAGAFLLALIMDIVYVFSGIPLWWEATFPVIVIGVIGALVAAVPGMIDLVSIVPRKKASRIGIAHMATNFILITLFVLNGFIRFRAMIPEPGTLYAGFWLSLIGTILLVIGGWLGGKLVYEYRIGVLEEEDYADVVQRIQTRHDEPPATSELESPA